MKRIFFPEGNKYYADNEDTEIAVTIGLTLQYKQTVP